MRFQFSRKLNETEATQARDLIAYAWAARIRGEALGLETQDSPYSFVVEADSTKSRSGDVGFALGEWEEMVRGYLTDGVHLKTLDDIPALDPNVRVEIYYDNVMDTNSR